MNRSPLSPRPARARQGFTLVEIILVVAIIMTLVGLVLPHFAGVLFDNQKRMTRIEIGNIKTALGNFEVATGGFPTTAQGLQALVVRPADMAESDWRKFMDNVPRDAWGREFQYACPGGADRDYDLASAGKDGKFGTLDDITSFDITPPKKAN